ncbi:unnamed protein product [Calypogeia fissa]
MEYTMSGTVFFFPTNRELRTPTKERRRGRRQYHQNATPEGKTTQPSTAKYSTMVETTRERIHSNLSPSPPINPVAVGETPSPPPIESSRYLAQTDRKEEHHALRSLPFSSNSANERTSKTTATSRTRAPTPPPSPLSGDRAE